MPLSDDIDEADIDDPLTTPVGGIFGSLAADDVHQTGEIEVLGDEVWDGDECTPVAYTTVQVGAFRFTLHLEDEQARAVAHDLLEAVENGCHDA